MAEIAIASQVTVGEEQIDGTRPAWMVGMTTVVSVLPRRRGRRPRCEDGSTPPPKNLMIGKWIPGDREVVLTWMRNELKKHEGSKEYEAMKHYFPDCTTLEEEVMEFVVNASQIKKIKNEINLDDVIVDLVSDMGTKPDVGMLVVEMFRQQDHPKKLNARDCIFLLNKAIENAPTFVDDKTGHAIPVPVGAILTYAMATPAGYAAFIKNSVNERFKAILNAYGKYLKTPASCNVLVDAKGMWFSREALKEMPNFDETFDCDPDKKHKGFESFDCFFTRRLKTGARKIAYPDDQYVVVNACENAPFRIRYSVGRHDAFWIKSQPYSLQYILADDEHIDKFVGGTIYQGFLSPHTYHRFHAPVSGDIIRAKVVEGTYFAQPYYEDEKVNYIASQPYLAHMATRGIIIIDTKNEDIGYVAFVPIGMVDVSTVDLSELYQKNEKGETILKKSVKKGDGIGTFRFGGSSHLIIFQKGVRMAFDLQDITPDPYGNEFLDVRSRLATIIRKDK